MTNVIRTGTIPGGCLGGEKTGAGKACQEIGRGLYSGGNRRKLSTAIALVGNPRVIFLVIHLPHVGCMIMLIIES